MANISSVNGTLYITAPSITECEEVYKLIRIITNKWAYEFEMYDDFSISEVIDSNPETDNEITMETSFYADGKWSFQNNARLFGKWLQNSDRIDSSPEVCSAIELLSKIKFVLEFEYDEDEPGCKFVATGNLILFHPKNTELRNSKIINDEFESHDLTVKSLMNYRGFDEEYAKEYLEEYYPNS